MRNVTESYSQAERDIEVNCVAQFVWSAIYIQYNVIILNLELPLLRGLSQGPRTRA